MIARIGWTNRSTGVRIERRRTELLSRRDALAKREARRADRYLGALQERDTDQIAHDLAWLDRLIDAERSSTQSSTEDLP